MHLQTDSQVLHQIRSHDFFLKDRYIVYDTQASLPETPKMLYTLAWPPQHPRNHAIARGLLEERAGWVEGLANHGS